MSVTYYLTDHKGNQIAFFYRVDNERYSTCPNILWACRQYPQFQGSASSKGEAIEAFKQTLKEIKKLSVQTCKDCGLTNPKLESQDACPECLTDKNTTK